MRQYVLANARRGDLDDVIRTIDRFCYEQSFMINVGDEKGEILDAAVRRTDPKLVLELERTAATARSESRGRWVRKRGSSRSSSTPRTPRSHAASGTTLASVTG